MTLLPGSPERIEASLLQLFDGSFRLAQRRGNLEQRPSMVRNLRNLFQRALPTEQELRTLHGVVRCLVDKRKF